MLKRFVFTAQEHLKRSSRGSIISSGRGKGKDDVVFSGGRYIDTQSHPP